MNMKINLNIIKIVLFLSFFKSVLYAGAYTDKCVRAGCGGCKLLLPLVKITAKKIDKKHLMLEKNIKSFYKDKILKPNLKEINKIQEGITKSIARINTMEHEANIDSKKLIWLLKKNKEFYTLPIGVSR